MLVLLLVAGRSEATERYRLDSANTRVSFVVQHLGLQWISASFPDIDGEFVLDRLGPGSRVDVTVATATLDCSEPRWNERLRSPEWLDAQRYPHMIYHSSSIQFQDSRAIANGDLTLHGITRPVALTVSFQNCSGGAECQFTAHGRIRRSDFALPHGILSGGDQVDIAISGSIRETAGPDSAGPDAH
jgi:polyisoprenoid-binding protein YceI